MTLPFSTAKPAPNISLPPQAEERPSTFEVQALENDCRLADTFTPEVKHWEQDICRWSKEHNMDPDLIATIMQIESCGNPTAVSATGVKGLFQVTGANLQGANGFDPNASMAAGPGKVLKNQLAVSGGDITSAMAGYNGGGLARAYIAGEMTRDQFVNALRHNASGLWRTLGKALAKVNEVERYAQWSRIFFEAKENKTDTLNEWLALGGAHLCRQAAQTLGLPG